jgi:hypothetical protein
VHEKQPLKPRATKKGSHDPVREAALPPGGVFEVAVHSSPPQGPADKAIHQRRKLPPTPDAPAGDVGRKK